MSTSSTIHSESGSGSVVIGLFLAYALSPASPWSALRFCATFIVGCPFIDARVSLLAERELDP